MIRRCEKCLENPVRYIHVLGTVLAPDGTLITYVWYDPYCDECQVPITVEFEEETE